MKHYIDADSLLYRASHLVCCKTDEALKEAEAIEDDGDEDIALATQDRLDTLEGMKKIFHSMVAEIVDAVKLEYPDIEETIYVLTVKPKLQCCAGMEDNFRYSIMADVTDANVKGYKSNRAGMEVPEGLNDIYEYVFNLPNTICVSGVEADDVVVRYGIEGHIISALDKDVIGSLEKAYNYGKKEWVENSPEDIWKFPYLQTGCGDPSDGLRGIYRVGTKKVTKMLEGVNTPHEAWKKLVEGYYLKEQTLDEAVATMRCVRMNQWTEKEGLVLWNPPKKETK